MTEMVRAETLQHFQQAVDSREAAAGDQFVTEIRVGDRDIEPTVQRLAEMPARFADLFISGADNGLTLHLVYALDRKAHYLVMSAPLEGDEYPLLSDTVPAAFIEECEAFEKFGVLPRGGKPVNRVVMPPQAEIEFPLSGGRRRIEPRTARAPYFVKGEAFEFPSGPVRVAGWESLYTGLVTTGEEVLDLYLFHWHKHRGVERRLIGLDPQRALFLVERADGLSAVGNSLAFCRAVEAIAGVQPPAQAASARAIALELERLYNHTNAIAMLCQTTGLSVGQAQAEIALEQLLRLNLIAFGHRYLFGILAPGGVTRGPNRAAVRMLLQGICAELHRTIEALLRTNSHVDRLEATGIVSQEAARRLALVGPVARASGCDLDVRRDHPFAPYQERKPRVPTYSTGDALARMQVFAQEIGESERLILAMLNEASEGKAEIGVAAGSALGWAESARGETLAWVAQDVEGKISAIRLRPASVRNWRAFDDAVRAQNVFTDVPIIEASFGLTVAGFAR